MKWCVIGGWEKAIKYHAELTEQSLRTGAYILGIYLLIYVCAVWYRDTVSCAAYLLIKRDILGGQKGKLIDFQIPKGQSVTIVIWCCWTGLSKSDLPLESLFKQPWEMRELGNMLLWNKSH